MAISIEARIRNLETLLKTMRRNMATQSLAMTQDEFIDLCYMVIEKHEELTQIKQKLESDKAIA